MYYLCSVFPIGAEQTLVVLALAMVLGNRVEIPREVFAGLPIGCHQVVVFFLRYLLQCAYLYGRFGPWWS